MIEVDQLKLVSKLRKARLEERVVEARPAMKEQQRGLFVQVWTFDRELCSLDIEEELNVIDCDAHRSDPQTRRTIVDDRPADETTEAEADARRSRPAPDRCAKL